MVWSKKLLLGINSESPCRKSKRVLKPLSMRAVLAVEELFNLLSATRPHTPQVVERHSRTCLCRCQALLFRCGSCPTASKPNSRPLHLHSWCAKEFATFKSRNPPCIPQDQVQQGSSSVRLRAPASLTRPSIHCQPHVFLCS